MNPEYIKTQVHNKTEKALKCAIFSIYFTRIKNLLKAGAYENSKYLLIRTLQTKAMSCDGLHIRTGTHEHTLASANTVRMGHDQTFLQTNAAKVWNSKTRQF